MENFKLTSEGILNVLNEIGINIPRHTKLKTDRLCHRLEQCLDHDAAQCYANLFDNENLVVNPSDYPVWGNKDDVTEGLHQKVWGRLSPGVGTSVGAFLKTCRLIVAVGEQWEEGVRKIALTDQEASAIAIRVSLTKLYTYDKVLLFHQQVHAIQRIGENRPMLVVGFATIVGSRKMGIKHAVKAFYAAPNQSQAVMIHHLRDKLQLLKQNQHHLSPDFAQSISDDKYTASFLLPTSWFVMEDLSCLGNIRKTSFLLKFSYIFLMSLNSLKCN
jgi:hypothetical protein